MIKNYKIFGNASRDDHLHFMQQPKPYQRREGSKNKKELMYHILRRNLGSLIKNEAFRSLIDFHSTTIERTKNRYEYRRKQREVEHFIAYENENLIGYSNVEYDRKEAIGYVDGLAVHPKYQHRGIGRYLLVEGIRQLRSNKCKYIELIAYFDNDKAVNLYQHIGFYSLEKKKWKCYRINTSSEKEE